jgi:hypothetical protein
MSEEQSVGGLLKQLRDESTTLIRDEVALAKTEMREKAAVYGRNIGALVAGALIGYAALVVILLAVGSLITEGLIGADVGPAMAHFLGLTIVGVVVAIISAVLVSTAINRLKQETLVPERTIETLRNDKEWAKQQIR